MKQFLLIAIRNLIKNKSRTLILGGAIVVVTTLMTVLLALTSGLQKTMMDGATTMLSGHVNIAGFFKISQTSAAPIVTDYKKYLELAKKEIPEAMYIIDRVKAYGKIISDTESIQAPMWGLTVENEKDTLKNVQMFEGNIFDLGRGTIALFQSHAKKLGVKVGDVVTISMPTYRNMSNTKDVKVIGIMKDMGMLSNFTVFFNAEDAREIYQVKSDTTGQIMIYLKNVSDVPKVEARLRKLVEAQGDSLMEKESAPFFMKFDRVAGESWTGQKIDITTWEDEISFLKWILDIFNTITFLLTAVLMVIIVLGLMNTLWMSIKERTSEVGTLRAIGLQRRQVLIMFFIEAMTLSVVSTLVGLTFGTLIALGVHYLHIPLTSDAFKIFLMSDVLKLDIRFSSLLTTFFTISFFVTIGSIYPSYKASRMKPITAINHVN